MLLSDLLQVLNLSNFMDLSNFMGIREMTADGTSYDMIYTGQIKTRSELNRVIEKYGKREVKEIDTSIDEGQLILIYIEVKRQ